MRRSYLAECRGIGNNFEKQRSKDRQDTTVDFPNFCPVASVFAGPPGVPGDICS
jgi:hypothetical protein